LISLANTKKPLFLVNRSGNRPSAEQADVYLDKAVELCHKAGFPEVPMLGDTDFTQTWKLDGWDEAGGVKFIFGFDANSALEGQAKELPDSACFRRSHFGFWVTVGECAEGYDRLPVVSMALPECALPECCRNVLSW
jgi:hypothetical protein